MAEEESWNLDNIVVLGNLESFISRNFDLIAICEAMITFGRMAEVREERKIFVGTNGFEFGQIIVGIEDHFKEALMNLSFIRHEILDVLNLSWLDHMLA